MATNNALDVISESRLTAGDWRTDADTFLSELKQVINSANISGLDNYIRTVQFTAESSDSIISHWQNYLNSYDPQEETTVDLLSQLNNFLWTNFPSDFNQPQEMKSVDFPSLSAQRPNLNFPTAPTIGNVTEGFPTEPATSDVDIPGQPTIPDLPELPTFETINLPDTLDISIEPLDVTIPTFNANVPSNTFTFNEVPYSYVLLDAINAELLEDINNGDYGLNIVDPYELQVWQRGRDRQTESNLQADEEVRTRWSARGFTIPQGVMNKAISQVRWQNAQAIAEYNRQVATEKVNLWLRRREFTFTLGREIEQMLMAYHGQVQERALRAAEVAVNVAIQIFNASVAQYNAQLEAVRTQIAVFESKRQIALAKLEAYRVEIEKSRLQIGIQENLIRIYLAQYEGIQSTINVWRTQIEAAQLALGIERQKIDIYRVKVDAFTERLRTKDTQINLYRALLDGEKTKIDVYAQDLNAFATETQAKKTKSDTFYQQFQAKVQADSFKLDKYRAQIDGENVKAQLYALTIDKLVNIFRDRIANFSAHIDEVRQYIGLKVDSERMNLESAIQTSNSEIAKARHQLDQFQTVNQMRGQYALAGAQIYTGLIAAVLNSIQTLVSQLETITEE